MGQLYPGVNWWVAIGWLSVPLFWAVLLCLVHHAAAALRRSNAVEREAEGLARGVSEDRAAAA